MIALLAQAALGCFAVYGLWTATIQAILGAIIWWGRRMNARQDREKAEGDSRARDIANEWMLKRLTAEDHTEIERIIHDSGGKVA